MIRCYVTDRRTADVVETAKRWIADGIEMIQLREKDLDGAALLALARTIVGAAAGAGTRVLVNDRLDVALAAGAHGLHLPSDGLPVALARPHVDHLGVSTHTPAEARAAEENGADFVVFGPVFDTPGKTGVGLDPLREVAAALTIPVLAIGGITEDNTPLVLDAGAAGIAAIRMFQQPGL
jgi:thiamine-phosphate pyrophosphorylase